MASMIFTLQLLLVAQWMLPAAAECSNLKENCNVTRCCSNKEMTCFEKNAEFADCRASCKEGFHEDDKGKWHTPWTCRALNRGGCSDVKENCNVTKCCQDGGLTCYEKDAEFASCKASCLPGVHEDDGAGYRTAWSCKVLKGKPINDPNAGVTHGDDGKMCGASFEKCGGKNYAGASCCQTGCKCKAFGKYYSSCRPIKTGANKCSPDEVPTQKKAEDKSDKADRAAGGGGDEASGEGGEDADTDDADSESDDTIDDDIDDLDADIGDDILDVDSFSIDGDGDDDDAGKNKKKTLTLNANPKGTAEKHYFDDQNTLRTDRPVVGLAAGAAFAALGFIGLVLRGRSPRGPGIRDVELNAE